MVTAGRCDRAATSGSAWGWHWPRGCLAVGGVGNFRFPSLTPGASAGKRPRTAPVILGCRSPSGLAWALPGLSRELGLHKCLSSDCLSEGMAGNMGRENHMNRNWAFTLPQFPSCAKDMGVRGWGCLLSGSQVHGVTPLLLSEGVGLKVCVCVSVCVCWGASGVTHPAHILVPWNLWSPHCPAQRLPQRRRRARRLSSHTPPKAP